jgi:predicted transcriptional regulator of viral defense system
MEKISLWTSFGAFRRLVANKSGRLRSSSRSKSQSLTPGAITRLARGLYQLADADVDANHTLAEASKLVPKGVICLTSALAYHGLTDQIPARVWLAIGPKDWRPRLTYPPMRFAHYPAEQLESGVERHGIDGVSVPIFSAAKTVADMFRYRRTVGLRVAIEGLREALRERKGDSGRDRTICSGWRRMESYRASRMRADARLSPPRDIGASIRPRLMNVARERGQVFNLLLTRHALERLLSGSAFHSIETASSSKARCSSLP